MHLKVALNRVTIMLLLKLQKGEKINELHIAVANYILYRKDFFRYLSPEGTKNVQKAAALWNGHLDMKSVVKYNDIFSHMLYFAGSKRMATFGVK